MVGKRRSWRRRGRWSLIENRDCRSAAASGLMFTDQESDAGGRRRRQDSGYDGGDWRSTGRSRSRMKRPVWVL
ncbi:unnamed protein product [Linum trigynum]|uniref:Uncharacterized protein n=1 Tax=Linum trigynum TaxID=586398 RepID=A0AAV2DE65_9ROSI